MLLFHSQIDGKREHIQKRLILCNLREAYQKFKENHQNIKIGFSKFASMRPQNCVLAGTPGTHSICVCTYHQNVKLMLLGSKIEKFIAGTDCAYTLGNYHTCLALMMCNPPTIQCFLNKCCNCPGFSHLRNMLEEIFEDNFVETIEYKQWTNTDRSTLENKCATIDDFLDCFGQKCQDLIPHNFIAERQSLYIKELKSTLSVNEFIVIMDFSENYTFVLQDAAQGFHWNNAQATVHPFGIYFRDPVSNELQCTNLIAISDCLKHNTVLVHVFQNYLIQFLKDRFGHIKKIHYFSDGSAAQYKNRNNFYNVSLHLAEYGIPAEWNFFATSHGKNISDGLGGTLKRLATKASLQKPYTHQIMTSRQLFDWAVENLNNMNFFFVTNEEYCEVESRLTERFSQTQPIPGTHKIHYVRPVEKGLVEVKIFSTSSEIQTFAVVRDNNYGDITPEDVNGFVTFFANNAWWLGCIISYDEDTDKVRISTLAPSGPSDEFFYSSPENPEISCIHRSAILRKVDPHKIKQNTYSLSKVEIAQTNAKCKLLIN